MRTVSWIPEPRRTCSRSLTRRIGGKTCIWFLDNDCIRNTFCMEERGETADGKHYYWTIGLCLQGEDRRLSAAAEASRSVCCLRHAPQCGTGDKLYKIALVAVQSGGGLRVRSLLPVTQLLCKLKREKYTPVG